MTVGERIRNYRELREIAQMDLAEMAGISKQTMFKYEHNVITNIPSDKIEVFGKILNVSPAVLMGWENEIILTDQEVDLLDKFRKLDDHDKGYIEGQIDSLLEKKTKRMEGDINVG